MEVVALFAGHADLLVLQGRLDLEPGGFEEFGDFLGFVAFEPLLEDEELARVSERGNIGLFLVHVAQVDIAFGEFGHGDLAQSFEARGILGGQAEVAVLLDFELGLGAFEVETAGQFAAGLVDRVEDFLAVHFGNDVE